MDQGKNSNQANLCEEETRAWPLRETRQSYGSAQTIPYNSPSEVQCYNIGKLWCWDFLCPVVLTFTGSWAILHLWQYHILPPWLISFLTSELRVATDQPAWRSQSGSHSHSLLQSLPNYSHCLRKSIACCGSWQTSALKIAGVPSYWRREKNLLATLNTAVSKPGLQLYMRLYKWAVYVNTLPLQTMTSDHISESFHSAACEETRNNEKRGDDERRRQRHHPAGQTGGDLDWERG